MFAAHNFLKRPSNFIKIHLQTPLPTKSYTSLPKLLGKIFTYAPLRFRKNMFAAHDFPEKVLELRNNPPVNPHCLRNFTCQSLTFPKNIYDPYFLKKPSNFDTTHPCTPDFYQKNFNFTQISKTHKHN
jgi:hypothetical protein